MLNINLYKEKKKQLNLTFEDLYQASGVPIQTLHNIFRGHTKNPRVDTIQAIEKALEISSEQTKKAPQDTPAELSKDEQDLLAYYKKLRRDQKEFVFNLFKSYFPKESNHIQTTINLIKKTS